MSMQFTGKLAPIKSEYVFAAKLKFVLSNSITPFSEVPIHLFPLMSIITELVFPDRKSTRLNSSHITISYAVFCLKKKQPGTGRSKSHRAACTPGKGRVGRRIG